MRASAVKDPKFAKMLAAAPKVAPARLDPMRAFAHYPTRLIGVDAKISSMAAASLARYRELARDPLFSYVPEALPAEDLVGAILERIAKGCTTPRELADQTKTDPGRIVLALSVLAKMGLVRVE